MAAQVLTILNESRANFEVVNVLDEIYNPGLRDVIKTYSQWPTIPQVRTPPRLTVVSAHSWNHSRRPHLHTFSIAWLAVFRVFV